MKILSRILLILLFLMSMSCINDMIELYDPKGPLKAFGVDNKYIAPLMIPDIISLIIFLSALVVSLFIIKKNTYSTVSLVCGSALIIGCFVHSLCNSLAFFRFLDNIKWLK